MQAFHAQRTEEFLAQVGVFLTDAVAEEQTAGQQEAMHELGTYIQAARSVQRISVESFARQLALSEAETYALEQGIFPYVRLTLPLLEKIAIACREEKEILLALLHAAQHQPVARPSVSAGAMRFDTMPHQQLPQPLAGHCSVTVGKNCVHDSRQQATAKTEALPQKHKMYKRFPLPLSLFWGQPRPFYSGFSRAQVYGGRRLLHKIAAGLSITWKLPTLNLPHAAVSMVAVASLCYFVLLHFGLLPGSLFLPTERSVAPLGTTLTPLSTRAHPELAGAEMALSGVEEINREGHNAVVGLSRTAQREITTVDVSATHPYRIIYTTDPLSDQSIVTSPLIPVSGNELAFIQTQESIPKIFYLCRVIGQMESCPM